jgi:hypothetical protein
MPGWVEQDPDMFQRLVGLHPGHTVLLNRPE